MPPIPIAEQILGVLKEVLSSWKVFIATREEAYKRGMDKKMKTAIEYGEQYIHRNRALAQETDKELIEIAKKFFKHN